jgi:hypothetical protein
VASSDQLTVGIDPGERRARVTDALFEPYRVQHDHVGRVTTTMRRLEAIRRSAVATREVPQS